MKCHYEILGIERQASTDDMKKAYKRLALKWHPDKNPGMVEEATVVFREIQQAYEVLSDPQERAWYDKNRDRILQGGFGKNESYVEERFDVFRFFTASCYNGFNDTEFGFFCVYGNVFSEIAEEERRACLDPTDVVWPAFGYSESSYDEIVHPFYEFWGSFNSCKSFAWKDEYDSSQAQSRYVRRKMEGENKKLRDAARKERNEEVRELVSFVKRRDPRVIAYHKQLRERAEVNAKKAREMQDRALRRNMEQNAHFQESDWCSMNTLEDELVRLEAELDDDRRKDEEKDECGQSAASPDENNCDFDMKDEVGVLCDACDKIFRSEKAFRNHEQSKRHRDNIRKLTELLKEDGFDFLPDNEESKESNSHGLNSVREGCTSKKSKKKQRQREKEEAVDTLHTLNETEEVVDESTVDTSTEIMNKPSVSHLDEGVRDTREISKNYRNDCKDSTSFRQTISDKCGTCQNEFTSRNKLFSHLKETGHAVRVEAELSKQAKKRKKKK